MTAGNGDELLVAKQVATMLRVSAWYVYELAKAGELPCIRLGKRMIRFRRETIAEVLALRESSKRHL